MARPSIVELRVGAREAFGRELDDAQLEAYRGRLATMIRNIQTLRQWEPKLRTAEPSAVQRVSTGHPDGS
jgi:hypothetical protein